MATWNCLRWNGRWHGRRKHNVSCLPLPQVTSIQDLKPRPTNHTCSKFKFCAARGQVYYLRDFSPRRMDQNENPGDCGCELRGGFGDLGVRNRAWISGERQRNSERGSAGRRGSHCYRLCIPGFIGDRTRVKGEASGGGEDISVGIESHRRRWMSHESVQHGRADGCSD